MLRIVSEIESIADCCLGAGKILVRKNQAHVEFTDTIYSNIDSMFILVKQSMELMLHMLKDPEHARDNEIISAYNKEREINNYRNQLRSGNIENINNRLYPYQAGIYYMDMVANLEKTGDYIINVVDAIKEQLRIKTA